MIPQVLADNGIGFLAVYKQVYITPDKLTPLGKDELDGLQATAGELGTLLADDDMATTYRLRPTTGHAGLFLQLGPDWHQLEQSYGQPFRWINGSQADLCVFSPAEQTAPLTFKVASFATPRHVQVWVGDNKMQEVEVPADGALHDVTTAPIQWPAGGQKVRLLSQEGSASPSSLGQGNDKRQLSLGLADVHLGMGSPAP